MSILLDALKKSEAQRQLGETPSIHTPVDPTSADPSPMNPWLIGLLLLSVAVVLALYVTEQFDEPDLSILGYSEIGPLPQAGSAADTAATQMPATDQARTPVERLKPSFSRGPQTSSRKPATNPRLSQSVSDYQPPPATSPAADSRAARSEPEPNASADARTSQAPQPAAAEDRVQAPPMLTYWQLPQGIRDNMPDLKISVLVYAAKPEERFILMEGKRLREGDDAGGGLDLEEIRRDGAVFSYRKYTFLLPN